MFFYCICTYTYINLRELSYILVLSSPILDYFVRMVYLLLTMFDWRSSTYFYLSDKFARNNSIFCFPSSFSISNYFNPPSLYFIICLSFYNYFYISGKSFFFCSRRFLYSLISFSSYFMIFSLNFNC